MFKDKEETIEKEGGNNQDISENLKALNKNILTASEEEPEPLSEKTVLETPTTVTPIKAIALPMTIFLSILTFRKQIEKIKVVTMAPPLII